MCKDLSIKGTLPSALLSLLGASLDHGHESTIARCPSLQWRYGLILICQIRPGRDGPCMAVLFTKREVRPEW